MAEKLVVFGNGTMAKLAHFYFTHDSVYDVVAFTLDREFIKDTSFLGLPIVPFENLVDHYPPDDFQMFVAIGYKKLNSLRADKFKHAKELGYTCASYFSSKATHWNDTIFGENCFILENQVFQPFVRIGDNTVIWSGNHFGHDVVIGSHCWLASHIVASGGVEIGDFSFVGVNATFRDNVHIGRQCIVGAGALMLRNASDKQVFIAKQTETYALDSERFERMMEISSS